jgi:hypothetical protein
MLFIGLSSYSASILLPEQARSLCVAVEASLEHPALLRVVFLEHAGRMKLLSNLPCNPLFPVPASLHLAFITLKDEAPLFARLVLCASATQVARGGCNP